MNIFLTINVYTRLKFWSQILIFFASSNSLSKITIYQFSIFIIDKVYDCISYKFYFFHSKGLTE